MNPTLLDILCLLPDWKPLHILVVIVALFFFFFFVDGVAWGGFLFKDLFLSKLSDHECTYLAKQKDCESIRHNDTFTENVETKVAGEDLERMMELELLWQHSA